MELFHNESESVVDSILRSSRAILSIAVKSLNEIEETISIPQYRILVILGGRGDLPMSEIVKETSLAPASATRLCDDLLKKGLIDRKAHLDDRRQVIITITNEGSQLLRRVTESRRGMITEVVANLGEADLNEVEEGFALFAKASPEPDEKMLSTRLGWS
ncbi:MAG: MarR family transcriptional regulator [Actinomycetota bacterium]|nr:MarR family transcriptional regulator [Actinomycetota bacterium]